MLVLVFDTETTGLPKNMKATPNITNIDDWPYLVQLSYILYDTYAKRVVVVHDHIIQVPSNVHITEDSTRIHGITNEMSKNFGMKVEEVILVFMEHFRQADLVVAHNVEFDKKIIMSELIRMQENNWSNELSISRKYYCTMQESIELCNITAYTKKDKKEYIKFPSLLELCNHLFQYEPKNLHNSLNDVLVCLQCFYALRFNTDICHENKVIKSLINTLLK